MAETNTKVVVGKFKIEQVYGRFFQFALYANNGQLLIESRPYASDKSCKAALDTFKANMADPATKCRIDEDKNHNFKFIFKNRNNIYVGETYSNPDSATKASQSVIKFAAVSDLVSEV